jgi:tripartite-type tricarboxylate transporter receptor subunit TctC
MTISRRTLIAALGAVPAATLLPRGAFAQAYPDRPIRVVVPFAPGGNADLVGRLVGDVLQRELNATVIVENRAGAGGGTGATAVARSEPDGYTLLIGSNGPLTVNPFVIANLGYDPLKDFAAVALTSYVPHVLILSNNTPAKNLTELVALSKKAPLNIGTSGTGSAGHMTLERFKAATGANLTHVPYKSGGTLVPDVLSGTINGAMTELSIALPLHKDKKAFIPAIASRARNKLAPDVPTFDESGVKGFFAESYVGVLAPAKTPPDIIAKVQKAIEKGFGAGTTTAERIAATGGEIATAEQFTSAGFGAFIKADFDNMKEAARLAGIKPE